MISLPFDPRGRPTVTAGSDNCFCTFVRPFVRPHDSKQIKFQAKTMFAAGETVGLAEWIIDDTFLLLSVLLLLLPCHRHTFLAMKIVEPKSCFLFLLNVKDFLTLGVNFFSNGGIILGPFLISHVFPRIFIKT